MFEHDSDSLRNVPAYVQRTAARLGDDQPATTP